ncbi:hypothetical protein BaRGS_00023897, partial [Batillaria attramentaria]
MKFGCSLAHGARMKQGVGEGVGVGVAALRKGADDPGVVALRCKAPPCPCSEALHYCLG